MYLENAMFLVINVVKIKVNFNYLFNVMDVFPNGSGHYRLLTHRRRG